MNILFYCDEYPPARNGGIGTVVKLVAEAMSRRGHKVVVVGKYWDGEEKKTVEYINGVTVLRWHRGSYKTLPIRLCNLIGSRKSKLWKAQLILRRTQRLLEKEALQNDIDLVELPDYVDDFMHFDGLRMPKWRVDVPRIIRVHGSVSFLLHYLNGQSNETKIQQDKAFFAQGDAICAVSSFSKEYVEKYIQPQKAVDVIYNPIR